MLNFWVKRDRRAAHWLSRHLAVQLKTNPVFAVPYWFQKHKSNSFVISILHSSLAILLRAKCVKFLRNIDRSFIVRMKISEKVYNFRKKSPRRIRLKNLKLLFPGLYCKAVILFNNSIKFDYYTYPFLWLYKGHYNFDAHFKRNTVNGFFPENKAA